jgi:hypothetical protein
VTAETTSPDLPSVSLGPFVLDADEQRRIEHRAGPTGAVDLELVRGDGGPLGDLAVTFVGADLPRRFARHSAARVRQVLLPGDYLVYVMGRSVQWVEAEPVRVAAGEDARVRLALTGATRCSLNLIGLPRPDDGRPVVLRMCDRARTRTSTYTLAADAPQRLAAVLAAGEYEVEHEDAAGHVWSGTFAVDGAAAPAPITVQMARR